MTILGSIPGGTHMAKNEGKDEAPASDEKNKGKGKAEEENPDFKFIVRLANTDLEGERQVRVALTNIKGIGQRMSTLLARQTKIDPVKRIGDCTDEEVEMLQKAIAGLSDTLPTWAVNRPNDPESGEDSHMVSTEIDLTLRDDLNRLKKIRSNRGIRHENNLPVRGQRTRSNGRTGLTIGVQRQRQEEG